MLVEVTIEVVAISRNGWAALNVCGAEGAYEVGRGPLLIVAEQASAMASTLGLPTFLLAAYDEGAEGMRTADIAVGSESITDAEAALAAVHHALGEDGRP